MGGGGGAEMDVARTAVRSAAAGSDFPGGGGAGVAAVMKLAPNMDVEALQSMAANWTSKAKEMSNEALSSLQSSAWDPLGAPVVGASGPIARAVGQVYHSSLAFRKEAQSEANNTVKTFEKRLATYEGLSAKAKDSITKSEAHWTTCKEKAGNVKSTKDALSATSQAVRALLESQAKIEEAREAAAKARAEAAEMEKENFTAGINKRREEVEAKFKEEEQKLMNEYKRDETQGFV